MMMAVVRRTISLPPATAEKLDREAEERGMTFSALITELVERDGGELPYSGLISDDPDLSTKVDEVLARLLR